MQNHKLVKNEIYLSRRNLEALLSKLDRLEAGEQTACTIVKVQGDAEEYKQTMASIKIIAVPDAVYYTALNRPAGMMHPADEIHLSSPSTGLHASDIFKF
jgi:hypothetical protein